MKIYTNIAGVTFSFSTEDGTPFTEESVVFRGFACAHVSEADYDIVVRKVSVPHVIDKTIGHLGEGENIGHTWHIAISDNEEIITVVFDVSPCYSTARLVLKGTTGVMELCPKTLSCRQEMDAYIFPLFNLMLNRTLHRRNGILVHSSVVDDGGKGYLFTAVSGTGKSTMARIWQSCGATIVNDDMIVLKTESEGIVTASNIAMPYYVSSPATVALKGIFLISQSKSNFIRPLTGAKAVLRLLSNTIYHPINKEVASRHLNIVSAIASRVPIFELGFKPDADIVDDIRNLNL